MECFRYRVIVQHHRQQLQNSHRKQQHQHRHPDTPQHPQHHPQPNQPHPLQDNHNTPNQIQKNSVHPHQQQQCKPSTNNYSEVCTVPFFLNIFYNLKKHSSSRIISRCTSSTYVTVYSTILSIYGDGTSGRWSRWWWWR